MSESYDLMLRSFVCNFISVYVCTSMDTALNQPRLEDFDKKVWEKVSQKLGIGLEMTKKLHHPLDWELLSTTNCTPLEVYSNGCNNIMHIRQGREYSEIERKKFCEEIEKKYGNLMESKLRLFVNPQR